MPGEILNKNGRPTDEEWKVLSGHPAAARVMLEPLRPWLDEWVHAADQHHCRWDGKGYPEKLAGDEISLAGRIVAVADAYDVMTSARSYKVPLSPELARQELTDCAGSQFDPRMVRAFLQIGLGRLQRVTGPLAWLANLTGSVQIPIPVGSSIGGTVWSTGAAVVSVATVAVGGAVQEPPPEPDLALTAPVVTVEDRSVVGMAGEPIELLLIAHSEVAPTFEVAQPAHGTISAASEPIDVSLVSRSWALPVSYEADAGYAGQDGFSFEACIPEAGCAIGQVDIVVEPVNRPPDARPDRATVAAREVVLIDVRANDRDPEGGRVDLVRVGRPERGRAEIVDGVVRYEADSEPGVVEFVAVVADPEGAEAAATVTVEVLAPDPPQTSTSTSTTVAPTTTTTEPTTTTTVPPAPINLPPSPTDDLVTVDEDTPITIDVTANDIDPEGDPVSVTGVGGALHGSTVVDGGQVSYTPAADFHGLDQFTYTVSDGINPPVVAIVGVTVSPVNDPPVAIASDAALAEDAVVGAAVLTVTATDADGDGLTYAITSGDPGGRFAIDGAGAVEVAGVLDHEATPVHNLLIAVSDGVDTVDVAVTVTVTDVDEPPTAGDDTASTAEDTPNAIPLGGNDADPESAALTWQVPASSTSGGSLSEAGGVVTYSPAADFAGTDTFTYTVTDPGGAVSPPATVIITVSPVNDPPVAVDDGGVGFTTPEDVAITTYDLTLNDTDVDDPLATATVALVTGPANGVAVVNLDRTVTYTPNLNYVGIDTFTYTVTDIVGATSAPATVTIEMTNTNDPPVAVDDGGVGYSTVEDTPLTTPDVTANDSDPEDVTADPASAAVVDDPANGVVINNGDGTFTYTPDADWHGTDSFTYTVYDSGLLLSNTATVTVMVSSVNDPPVATGDSLSVDWASAATTIDVRLNDSDIEGGPIAVVAVTDGSHGTTVENGDGTITYTHDGSHTLTDSFTYTIDDPGGLQDTAVVTVTVNPPEDHDGVPAGADNCAFAFNPDQLDTDGDGLGDAWDSSPTVASSALLADDGQNLGPGKSFGVALADVDGDGDLDAVHADSVDGVDNTVWLNDGSGVFSNSGQSLGGVKSVAVLAADLDGDGDIDLVFANAGGQGNTVWLNDGSGVFTDSGLALGSADSQDVAVGNLDDDGDLDLIFANAKEPNTIWFNDGVGGYTQSVQTLGDDKAAGVTVGDLDGDGDLDLVFADNGDDNTIWFNDGTGTFTDSGQLLGNGKSHDPALADLDGDGDLDLALAEDGDGDTIWFNNGSGTFTDSGQTIGLGHSRALSLGDLDGDGDVDVVLGDHNDANSVWLNNGSGVFTDSGLRLGNWSTEGLTTGDVNGDGTLDVLTANDNDDNLVWLNS